MRAINLLAGWLYVGTVRSPRLKKLVFRAMGVRNAMRHGYRHAAPTRCVREIGDELAGVPGIVFEPLRDHRQETLQETLFGNGRTACPPLPHGLLDFPGLYRLSLAGATVYANGVVLTPDNEVLRDVCPDFGSGPDWHRVCAAWRLPEPRPLAGTLGVLSSLAFAGNYYHWLFDTFARLPLLPPDFSGSLLVEHSLPYQRDYLSLAGIAPERCLEPSPEMHWKPGGVVVPSLPGIPGVVPLESVAFLRGLRDRVLTGEPRRPGRRVYLQRGAGGARGVRNAAEVADNLSERGFETVDPGALPVREQMRLLWEADWVVGVHGAAMANLVYCRPGTTVVELHSDSSVNWCYRRLCAVAGLRYGCLLCPSPRAHRLRPPSERGLCVPTDRLAELLDQSGLP